MDPIFYFDFGSPNAFLAHRVIPQVEARIGRRFVYRPVLLGGLFKLTGNRSPVEAFADIPAKLAYDRLEMDRFIARHGIVFRMNPFFPVNTLHLMRGAVAAERDGVFDEYVEAIFHFMWEEPRKLDDPEILRDTLVEAGLPEALLARSQHAEVKAQLIANTQDAFDHGAFGIPSFLVGTELYFGKDRLRDVEAELTKG
uniref:2-hydroxychromene-2-carboxylate isomerase n=1 Tax=Sphingomonas sp. TaxID=28214 RepID=UPI00260010ED|nr:2-hydroxychromene-2-carboxylate isomerase [Sphingomonas sp.]